MDIINECANDVSTFNECGNLMSNIHDFDILHVDKQVVKCQNCRHRIKTDCDFSYCLKCSLLDQSYSIGEIEDKCRNNSFVIQKKKHIINCAVDIHEIYKIKIDRIFGVMSCVVKFEENDWSSTPHNYYSTTIYLFRNGKNRNKYFNNLWQSFKN